MSTHDLTQFTDLPNEVLHEIAKMVLLNSKYDPEQDLFYPDSSLMQVNQQLRDVTARTLTGGLPHCEVRIPTSNAQENAELIRKVRNAGHWNRHYP